MVDRSDQARQLRNTFSGVSRAFVVPRSAVCAGRADGESRAAHRREGFGFEGRNACALATAAGDPGGRGRRLVTCAAVCPQGQRDWRKREIVDKRTVGSYRLYERILDEVVLACLIVNSLSGQTMHFLVNERGNQDPVE
jgi:hypothetical protein